MANVVVVGVISVLVKDRVVAEEEVVIIVLRIVVRSRKSLRRTRLLRMTLTRSKQRNLPISRNKPINPASKVHVRSPADVVAVVAGDAVQTVTKIRMRRQPVATVSNLLQKNPSSKSNKNLQPVTSSQHRTRIDRLATIQIDLMG